MHFAPRVRQGPSSYSPNQGSVLFAEPPNWVERSKYTYPVLYGHPACFSPLSQAAVRGFKDTVKSILENNRKQQIKKLHKSTHQNDSDVLIGDATNEEFSIIVDDGYSRQPPTQIDISPLQIACAEYVGTSLQKYLTIVELLVSYGANIHAASWFTSEPPPEAQERLDAVTKQRTAARTVRLKMLAKVRSLEAKAYTQSSDQNERMADVRMAGQMHAQMERLMLRERDLTERERVLRKQCTRKQMVNDSPYVIALRQRQKCNDTALIEAMVKGSLVILKSIVKAKGVGTVLSEGIVQIIVEYCNGLSLKLWDV